MAFTDSLEKHGITPAQHHDRTWEIPVRLMEVWGRVIDRDEYGNWVYDEDSIGDVVCRMLWKKSSRENSGWSHAWPAIMAGGGGGGGGNAEHGDGPPGGGLVSFSGVRTDFSNGSPNAGIDTGLLTRTTPTDPGSAFGQTRGQGNQDPNAPDDGQGPDTPTEGGSRCRCDEGNANNGVIVPIFDEALTPDSRYEPKMVSFPEEWPKYPAGTPGIALAGTDEYAQHDLFFPIDPRLIAVNWAGCIDMSSIVADLNEKSEIDKERLGRLHSVFRVIKKPLGAKNSIGIQYGPSGCGDTEGGWIWDRPSGGRGGTPTRGGGGGSGTPTGFTYSSAPAAGIYSPSFYGSNYGGAPAQGQYGVSGYGYGAGGPPAQGIYTVSGSETGPGTSPGYGTTFGQSQGVVDFHDPSTWPNRQRPEGGGGAGGGNNQGRGQQGQGGGKLIIANMSHGKGGPIDPGSYGDKHKIGGDADSHDINSAHISTDALFRRNWREDGPLFFEGDYVPPPPWPYIAKTHLTWDDPSQKWKWYTEVPFCWCDHPEPPS